MGGLKAVKAVSVAEGDLSNNTDEIACAGDPVYRECRQEKDGSEVAAGSQRQPCAYNPYRRMQGCSQHSAKDAKPEAPEDRVLEERDVKPDDLLSA